MFVNIRTFKRIKYKKNVFLFKKSETRKKSIENI